MPTNNRKNKHTEYVNPTKCYKANRIDDLWLYSTMLDQSCKTKIEENKSNAKHIPYDLIYAKQTNLCY
jgi:hypothetical protein